MVADHRAVARITHRLIEVAPRHDVLVGRSMTAVLGIPAAQQSEPLGFLGHCGANVGEFDAWDCSIDYLEFPFHADRSIRLRIKCIVMTGASLCPDQDTVDVRFALSAAGLRTRAGIRSAK